MQLDLQTLARLRLARGTVANFGREYAKGWNCDGCERHFASGIGVRGKEGRIVHDGVETRAEVILVRFFCALCFIL